VRYILYAIVVLSVINLIIIIRAEDDKQISQTAKEHSYCYSSFWRISNRHRNNPVDLFNIDIIS